MAKRKSSMFKTAFVYRLSDEFALSAAEMSEQLAKCRFHPCGPHEPHTIGFVPPRGDASAPLVYASNNQFLITIQEQSRLLPGSVVNEEVAKREEKIFEQEGRRVGRKERKDLKEAVFVELLPKAFVKTTQTRVWINPAAGLFVIEAGAGNKSDAVLTLFGNALDKFPVVRLNTTLTPETAMTDWVLNAEAPGLFTVDRDCELRSSAEERAAVRYVRHNLDSNEVRSHIQEGKRTARLALTYDDRLSFVLTDKMEIKGIKLLDVVKESLTEEENEDDLFDAELALMAGEYTRLVTDLVSALGGEIVHQV